ncbi:phosphopyruvate hydratase [Dehalococcoidia bacterium]|nr:phosphopyruvate hydratase [Dehalococcoidia bacterium]
MSTITEIRAREVLDSRGNPTVEVDVTLSDGAWGRAVVPSGASTGSKEALELRDGDPNRYYGHGVIRALENIRNEIASEVVGCSAENQRAIDRLLIDLDGTPDKGRLGANAILGVSLAVVRASAESAGKPLYAYLAGDGPLTLPVPMLNVINGGRHADNSTDFQEFMVVPTGFGTFREALRAGVEIYHALLEELRARGMGNLLGDEGGFAPALETNRLAVQLVMEAIEKAGYTPGGDCHLALDIAATEFSKSPGRYDLRREGMSFLSEELIEMYETLKRDYPIISIEDGLSEDDWDAWPVMNRRLGDKLQIVGDDLFATRLELIRRGIEMDAGNAVLLKLNQVGTVTETLDAIATAKEAGWGTIISHRSGETEDSSIADLAVGTAAGQIKAGAPARGERVTKYNRLLRIEEELDNRASFAGPEVYQRFS